MTTKPASPKRRHILSSINPEDYSASQKMEYPRSPSEEAPPRESQSQPELEQPAAEDASETRERKKTTRFRFKSKKSSRSHRDRDDKDDEESSHRHRRHRHHHHSSHHRHKRRRTQSRSPTPPNPFEPPPLGSEAAFRESLFDAMADDEGAAYWENVYGQPIHIYSQTRTRATNNGNDDNKDDEGLEQMNDDEYAAFVRQKMWEKTHQGLLEERARREERRKQKDKEQQEAERLTRDMERSLRRGEERRRKKGWKERFDDYVKAWSVWDGAPSPEAIAWPVRSGQREDIDMAAVKDFFVMGIDPEDTGEADFLAKLKEERVRWHPDKIQQKLGGKVDEAVMRDVTAVFQIVDKLWSDTRAKRQ